LFISVSNEAKSAPNEAPSVEVSEKDILAAAKEIRGEQQAEKKEARATRDTFSTIVIDPPWPMTKIERDVRPNQIVFDYPVMSEQELQACMLETWEAGVSFATKNKINPLI
jgi:hypothetical protein